MRGLLKAYVELDLNELGIEIPDRYVNRPERMGVTLNYGSTEPWLIALHGAVMNFQVLRYVEGPKSCFLVVRSPRKFNLPEAHITLGWVEGSAPVAALEECKKLWTMDSSIDVSHKELGFLVYSHLEPQSITGLIEWSPWTNPATAYKEMIEYGTLAKCDNAAVELMSGLCDEPIADYHKQLADQEKVRQNRNMEMARLGVVVDFGAWTEVNHSAIEIFQNAGFSVGDAQKAFSALAEGSRVSAMDWMKSRLDEIAARKRNQRATDPAKWMPLFGPIPGWGSAIAKSIKGC